MHRCRAPMRLATARPGGSRVAPDNANSNNNARPPQAGD